MTLIWKDPPNGRRIFTLEVLEELRANPGQWALIREYGYIHGRTVKPPPSDIEVRWVDHFRRTEKRGTELYARARPK